MNNPAFCLKPDHPLKRSHILDPAPYPPSTRSSLLKRSSFTLTPHTPLTQYPRTPKGNLTTINTLTSTAGFTMSGGISGSMSGSGYYAGTGQYETVRDVCHNSSYGVQGGRAAEYRSVGKVTEYGSEDRGRDYRDERDYRQHKEYREHREYIEHREYKEQREQQEGMRQVNGKIQRILNALNRHQQQLAKLTRAQANTQDNMKTFSKQQQLTQTKLQRYISATENNLKLINSEIQKIQQLEAKVKDFYHSISTNLTGMLGLNKYADKVHVDERISQVSHKINEAVQAVSKELMRNVANMAQMHSRDRMQERDRIEGMIREGLEGWEKKYRKDKQQQCLTESSSTETIPSKKCFIGEPLLLKSLTRFSICYRKQQKILQQLQTVYKMDSQGYLLDSNSHYLVNSSYEQVRLSAEQLELMRQQGYIQ